MNNRRTPYVFFGKSKLFKKLVSLTLAFSIFIQPLLPVFAQEVPQTDTVPENNAEQNSNAIPSNDSAPTLEESTLNNDQQTLGDDVLPNEGLDQENDKKIKDIGDENQQALALVPTDTNPAQAPNAINRLTPQIDNVTGALVYNYDITVPSGRNAYTTPDIGLVYNSSNELNDSVFGYGWSVNIPYIQRINRKGTNNLYSRDEYASSMSGELISLGSGSYAARTETGDFLTYTLSGSTWTVVDKNGTTYTFGINSQSRQDNSSNVYKWMLEEVRDTNDNFIRYEYTKAGGQIYPSKIFYSGNDTTDGIFEIDFNTESRSDVVATYSAAFSVSPVSRIDTIVIKIDGTTSRSYNLDYTTGHNANRSLLSSITETGYTEGGVGTTLPATTFQYQSVSDSFTYASSMAIPVDYNSGFNDVELNFNKDTQLVDINGDGLLDFVKANGAVPGSTASGRVWLNTGTGWSYSSTWVIPVYYNDGTNDRQVSFSTGAQLTDINGDGLVDFITAKGDIPSGTYQGKVWLNTGAGWTYSATWAIPTYYDGSNTVEIKLDDNGKTRVVDINGDGLPDIVKTNSGYDTSNNAGRVWINNGAGWTYNSGWAIPIAYNDGSGDVQISLVNYTVLTDINGDGLPDFVIANGNTTSVTNVGNKVWLNTGTGWTYNSAWAIPIAYSSGGDDYYVKFNHATILVDINADGLPDIVNANKQPVGTTFAGKVWLNTGTGWTYASSWAIPIDYNNGTDDIEIGLSDNTQFADFNGDGLLDIMVAKGKATTNIEKGKIYINTGSGWALRSGWAVPVSYNNGTDDIEIKLDNQTQIQDVNADGLPDIVKANGGDPTNFNLGKVWLNNGKKSDYLSVITSPEGGSTTIDYKLQTIVDKNSLSVPQPQYLYVVKSTQVNDGFGTSGTTTYDYQDGKYYYYTSEQFRKFAGFGTITKTDPAGNVTKTYYHQGNATNTTLGEYADNSAKIGKAYRSEEYDNANNLYRLTVDKWDHYNIGTNHDFVKLVRETVLTYDGNSGHKDTATEYTYDDTNGSLLTQAELGEVTGSTDGSFTDTGSDKRVTTNTYATNGTTKVVAPYNSTVTDQSSSKVKEDKYYYDSLSYGSVSIGNQTKVEQWVTGSTYVNSQKAYDSTYGTVTSDTDQRGKVTSYSYDTYNLYPTTVTDPYSQTVQYTYDYSIGKPKQVTDKNGFVYQTVFDGLDRVIEEKIPDFTSPYSSVTKNAYIYTDTSGAVKVQKTQYLDGTITADTYQYFDGMGRLIQERKEAESSGNFNVKDTIYSNLGLVQKQSLPYTSSGSSKTSATSTTSLYSTYTYDPLKRISTQVDALGTTSYAYDDWKTTVTDKNSKVKKYYKDAYSNLIKVDEVNGASTYTTNYEWNLNGKLTKITDALSNIRNFTYDGLGRRLTAEDLHASGDGTYGTWSYSYDDAGNLTQTISPRSLTTNYTYNDINQVLTEDYTGNAGIEITYTYGGCTNGVAKLCSMVMTSGADTSYTYDSNGNIASETKTINSTGYTTSYTYDRQGNVLVITYPDSAQVRYTFNTTGLLEKIERKESGGSYSDVVSNFDYNPMDQITTQAYVNNVTTTNTYDATKLYQLTRRLTQNTTPTKFLDLNYTYDNQGNITQIIDSSDTSTSKTANYVYDDLYRLTSATITSVASGQSTYTYTFSYDAIGNITSGPIGSYSYAGTSYANPHAATSINSVTYSYDNDGNVTGNGTLSNTWNYKDQLTQAVVGGVTSTYTYDHQGNRVSLANGATTTVYPNKYYNTDGTKKTKQIYAGDQLVATVETVGSTVTPYYDHVDQLNSVAAVTNGSGASVETLDYFPYGDQRISSSTYTGQRQYIGQIYDTDTGLDYLNARYYKANIGRFMSQDPVFLNPESFGKDIFSKFLSDPQSQNAYAYARNNPITTSDPNGKFIPLLFAAAPSIIAGVEIAASAVGAYIFARDIGTITGTAISNAPNYYKNDVYGNVAEKWGAIINTGSQISSSVLKEGKLLNETTLQTNKAAGAAFEAKTAKMLEKNLNGIVDQVTLRTQSGVKVRMDIVGRDSNGTICLVECKSSLTAPLTKNQSLAFPEIDKTGAMIVGNGKAGFPGGTIIPPTKVKIIRKK